MKRNRKTVAIVGAGAAGLAVARHCLHPASNNIECTIFEQTGRLGGTWVYSERVGLDEFGLPVHSSMYAGLRTNLPKEIMGFPDFPIPECKPSYLPQSEILEFLESYAKHFQISDAVQYYHHVKTVRPGAAAVAGSGDCAKWIVEVDDVKNRQSKRYEFDSVVVCNGHYYDPLIPNLRGIERFEGRTWHSHDYRKPDVFSGRNVLIIGAGPSGMDIALQLSSSANKVYLSHHLKEKLKSKYPSNVVQKPDVEEVFANSVRFADGTEGEIDILFYCTGYNYKFPFLDESCKITVEDNHIEPLYKHMVNIEYPSMCFIGIPFNVCAFQMFDLQARYYVSYLSDRMQLPSKEEMRADTAAEMAERWRKGYVKRQAHLMGPDQAKYYRELASAAKTEPIAPVIIKLRDASAKRLMDDLINFRNDEYKIIDNETFIKVN